MAGCVVRKIASDRWMTTPGIFARVGVLDRGTVITMSELGSSVDWHAVTLLDPLRISQWTVEPVDNSDRSRLSVDNWARHRR
jgi:hypothetical protein